MTQANRGIAFENLIDYTNRIYEHKGLAIINKRPTPVKILGNNGRTVHGYLEKPSTVDYDGTYQGGKSIVFEAKSIKELDRFDLKNLHDHQVEYLKKCHDCGAISFILVEFTKHRTIYLMPYETLQYYWNRRKKGVRGTASIPLEDFEVNAYQVTGGSVPVDYLSVVNKLWKMEVA